MGNVRTSETGIPVKNVKAAQFILKEKERLTRHRDNLEQLECPVSVKRVDFTT